MGIVFLLVVIGLTYQENGRSNEIKIRGYGVSMQPYFQYGEVVTLNPIKKNYKVGDIIAFEWNGQNIIHRIVDVDEDEEGVYYITRGDNMEFDDRYQINNFGQFEFQKDFKLRNNDILGVVTK